MLLISQIGLIHLVMLIVTLTAVSATGSGFFLRYKKLFHQKNNRNQYEPVGNYILNVHCKLF